MTPQEYNSNTFPKDSIDPAKKDKDWGLAYAKACWQDWSYYVPRTCFYNAGDRYELNRLYAIGDQPINNYKKWMGVDEQTNLSWLNIDWSVSPVVGTIRDIAISRMIQQEYGIVATPIDPLAKTELEQMYAGLKAKIAVRQMLQKQGSDLTQHPLLFPGSGEPIDEEELSMRIEFGEQFNRSKDAEQAIKLGLYNNNENIFRQQIFEDLFDYGVAGYYEWLGEDNKPKFRGVNVEAVISNYCRKKNFSDQRYAGELIDMDITDLAEVKNADGSLVFSPDQLETLSNDVAGRYSNQQLIGRSNSFFKGFDRGKVKVLQLRWFSYNDYYFNSYVDKNNNPQFEQKEYFKAKNAGKNGGKRKYDSKRIKVVYQINWIIGTDYAYDFKLATDMPRSQDPKKKWDTTLGYRFIAWNFYEMRAKSMMERLIPTIDQYQMNIYRMQNIKNRLVPSGWWVDLDMLEATALSRGGKNMGPLELLDMFWQTGILVGRSKDVMGDNVNYKPVIAMPNSIANEMAAIYQDMVGQIQLMKQMVGLNDATDATTIDQKTLNGATEAMNVNTNNALFRMQQAERELMQQLANDIMIRTQQGLKKGGISGFAPSLNSNALQFMQVSPTIGSRYYGIMLEEKSTDDQKMFLVQQMQPDIANGFLDSSDAIYILNTYNIKQAQQMWAYKVKKNKQAMSQQQQQMIMMQKQGDQQSAQLAAQLKEQLETMKKDMDFKEAEMVKQFDVMIAKIKTGSQEHIAHVGSATQMATAQMSQQEPATAE